METLVVVGFFMLVLVPSLLPSWRSMLFAVAGAFMIATVCFVLALHELGNETSGEGPAFFAMILLFGAVKFVLCGSCVGRAALTGLLEHLRASAAITLRRGIIGVGALLGLLMLTAHVTDRLAGIGLVIGMFFIWLSLLAWRLPVRHGAQ